MPDFTFTEDQEYWTSRRRQGVSPARLRELLIKQRGRCALSGVLMDFSLPARTPEPGGRGCHPLSPAVDHVDPGNPDGEVQLVCYALNDVKGHLPLECFKALQKTAPWKALMDTWKKQARLDPADRDAFGRILRPNAVTRAASQLHGRRGLVGISSAFRNGLELVPFAGG